MDELRAGTFFGAISDLTNTEYHSFKSYWSSSDLKFLFATSSAHFYDKYFVKPREPNKRTDAKLLGSLLHCTLLSPQDLASEFVIAPKFYPKVKKTDPTIVEQKENWQRNNPGKDPITEELQQIANEMAGSVLKNSDCEKLLVSARKELSLFWTCPLTGMPLKAKIDAMNDDTFIELKSARNGKQNNFAKQVFNLNYDLSLAHYSHGITAVFKKTLPAIFIAVESFDPYVSQNYPVGDFFMQLGNEKWIDAITKLEAGIKKDDWPAYYKIGEAPFLDPPSWAMSKSDVQVESVDDDIF